jgi:CzcA family heavy metal efflux pump
VITSQRRFIYLMTALLSVAGIWAAFKLPSAIYPELNFSRITIVTQGSALGARQILFAITRPIEEAVSIVPGVRRVQSRSIRGASEVNVTFAPGTDMIYALQQVQARVNEVRSDLPDNLDIQIERQTPSLFPIIAYNVEGGDPSRLYDIARYQIKPLISRVPGVGRVDVTGSDVAEVEVVADPARLAAQGMTFDDLATAIRNSIGVEAVGRMPRDYRQYLIVTAQEAHSPDDIGNIVVSRGLRVRDLAVVSLGVEDKIRIIAGDGRPAALISITRQIGGSTLAVSDSVASVVRSLQRTLPSGVRLSRVYDQAALVRDAVKSVRDAMVIGAVLAVIVLLLFLRHARITAISASAIPITLAITVLVMWLVGQTFNLMTLGAMAIAIGLVIDDAVVITENIIRRIHLDSDRSTAIRNAVRELLWPVTTSTLTTVVVFLPLGLLTGVVGQFFHALSITLTIAVLVSLLLALSIIPLLSEQFLTEVDTDDAATASGGRFAWLGKISTAIDNLSARYEQTLAGVLSRPRRVAYAAGVLIVAGFVFQRFVSTGFLPEMDESAFVLDYFTPGGTALAETDREVHIVENILARTPEVMGTSRRTGSELGLFATAQNQGDIAVRLRPESQRRRSSFEVIDDVRAKIEKTIPRLRVEFVQILSDVINDLAGNAHPVEIKLFGPDLEALEGYAEKLEPAMSKVGGLEDFYNGVSEPSAELAMTVHSAESNRIGLTPTQVGTAVAGALLGVPAGEIRLDDRVVGVRVRAPDSVRFNAVLLGSLPVVSDQSGAAAPLASLASFQPMETRGQLLRENQQQMITMTADVSGRSLGAISSDVKRVLAQNPPPHGIRVELGGRYAGQREAFRALISVLVLAAASVILVMVIQFQSFVEPLVILLAAPLSFVGAVALLFLTRTPLNVSSFMGLILLVGLIVKNGIILLDFTRRRMLSEGLELRDALLEAGRIRLRPILMTTLCTLFGLLPLALGLGAGSALQRPLALAVIGGLALSTPITLYMVPTLLVVIRGRHYKLSKES